VTSIDVVAEFLHTGSPPLNADDAAIAIVGALTEAGYEIVPAGRDTQERLERTRQALGDLASLCPPHIMNRYREIRRERRAASDPSKCGSSDGAEPLTAEPSPNPNQDRPA
jgi:hypothetical protein